MGQTVVGLLTSTLTQQNAPISHFGQVLGEGSLINRQLLLKGSHIEPAKAAKTAQN